MTSESFGINNGLDLPQFKDDGRHPIGERKLSLCRFTSSGVLYPPPGVCYDVLPISGPVLVGELLVQVGQYANVAQKILLQAVSPPVEPIRHCWLYMYKSGT